MVFTLGMVLRSIYTLLAVNLLIDVAMRGVALYVLTWCFNHRIIIENKAAYWITLFLMQDLAFYKMHYMDHKVRLFWAVHVTHHNSQKLNLVVGLRSSVFEPIYRFIYFIQLAWFGMQPLYIFFVFSLTQ